MPKATPPVTRLDRLCALRDRLTTLANDAETPPAAVAALAGRLVAVLEQIDELERAAPKKSRVDELANRRKARRSDAAGGVPARKAVDRRQ